MRWLAYLLPQGFQSAVFISIIVASYLYFNQFTSACSWCQSCYICMVSLWRVQFLNPTKLTVGSMDLI
ncbi:hypothetical protein L6452_32022 [Arctium lappa]|uniref:Uncharacterized protein n=1 Tax=Arctium lappa TaxID=4217 RepID=A0ACB8Z3D5_ARCLA|nr:hypothetical protein L6452_32022 [Arctium lappa]